MKYFANKISQSRGWYANNGWHGDPQYYRTWDNVDNLKTSGKLSSANNIAGKNGTYARPSTLYLSDFNLDIPKTAKIEKISIGYTQQQQQFSSPIGQTAYPDIPAPQISLALIEDAKAVKIFKTITGRTATTKQLTQYIKSLDGTAEFGDISIDEINDSHFGVVINYPANANTNTGSLHLKDVYLEVTFSSVEAEVSTTLVSIDKYKGGEVIIDCSIRNISKTQAYIPDAVITHTRGISFVEKVSGNGEVKSETNAGGGTINWTTLFDSSYKATIRLKFKIASAGEQKITIKDIVSTAEHSITFETKDTKYEITSNFPSHNLEGGTISETIQYDTSLLSKHTANTIYIYLSNELNITNTADFPNENVTLTTGKPAVDNSTNPTNTTYQLLKWTPVVDGGTAILELIFTTPTAGVFFQQIYTSNGTVLAEEKWIRVKTDGWYNLMFAVMPASARVIDRMGDGIRYTARSLMQYELELDNADVKVDKNIDEWAMYNNSGTPGVITEADLYTSDNDLKLQGSNWFLYYKTIPMNNNMHITVTMKIPDKAAWHVYLGDTSDTTTNKPKDVFWIGSGNNTSYVTINYNKKTETLANFRRGTDTNLHIIVNEGILSIQYPDVSRQNIMKIPEGCLLGFWGNTDVLITSIVIEPYIAIDNHAFNTRFGVFNDDPEYLQWDNTSEQNQFLQKVAWSSKPATQTAEIRDAHFSYNDEYPIYFVWTGYYASDESISNYFRLHFTDPQLYEENYEMWKTPALLPYPLKNMIKTSSSNSDCTLKAMKKTEDIIIDLWDLGGLQDDPNFVLLGIEVFFEATCHTTTELIINLVVEDNHNSKVMGTRSVTIHPDDTDDEKDTYSVGGEFDLFGLTPGDFIGKMYSTYLQIYENNPYNQDSFLRVSNVSCAINYNLLEGEGKNFAVNHIRGDWYGIFLRDVTLDAGTENEVKYYQTAGTDMSTAYRSNIKASTIQLDFDIDECYIEDNMKLRRVMEKLFSNDRNKYNKPILKGLELDIFPDVVYWFVRENKIDIKLKNGVLECSVKLKIPSGTSESLELIHAGLDGNVDGLAKVQPTIYLVANQNKTITIHETITSQSMTIVSDEIKTNDLVIVNCNNRTISRVRAETTTEFMNIDTLEVFDDVTYMDPDTVDITDTLSFDSDWFSIQGEYRFNTDGTAVFSQLTYKERW